MPHQKTIEAFIVDSLAGGRTSIDPDEPLISSGILDSLGMLRLIAFLEEQMSITIGDGEVGPENFGTIRSISAFVDRKLRQPVPPF
jgi:acyl carrier protein